MAIAINLHPEITLSIRDAINSNTFPMANGVANAFCTLRRGFVEFQREKRAKVVTNETVGEEG